MTVPESNALRVALAPVSRRLAFIVLLEGAAAGFVFAIAIAIAGWIGRWHSGVVILTGVSAAALTALILMLLSRHRREQMQFVARLIEGKAPGCRNLLVTASELLDQPGHVRPEIAALVQERAAKLASSLQPQLLFSSRNATVALGTTTALWALLLIASVFLRSSPAELSGASTDAPSIKSVEITITAPHYAARTAEKAQNPDRIEVLAGSRIRVTATGSAAGVTLETLAGRLALDQIAGDAFSGELIAAEDGYIALEPVAADGRKGDRRLMGLSVVPDFPPVSRLTAPGRDLFVPDGRRTINVAIDASDDLGLASLRLRYTRVSGAGEQFTFTEGEVPLTITRSTDRMWTAQGSWNLESLRLEPGDIIVYRAVVTDRRPGAAASESDTYIIEITGPGALAAGGFSVDEERDRYAISQQMVILKTERLLARKSATPDSTYAAEANDIAAEQRKVRAEFVFMMGGELADEIAPDMTGIGDLDERTLAAMDDEAIAGRLANTGRLDLVRALRAMSHAASALTAADLTPALAAEKEALAFLQRAFSRTRYILRTLTERERLDQARRLTGMLTDAASDRRPIAGPAADSNLISLRTVLAGVAAVAGSSALDATTSSRTLAFAVSVLRVDAGAEPLQRVAAALTDASKAMNTGRNNEARRLLDQAASQLASVIRGALPDAPHGKSSIETGNISGALIEALRRGGSPR